MPGRPRPHGHQDAAGRQYLSVGDLPIWPGGQTRRRGRADRALLRAARTPAPANRTSRHRAACLVCCLPLLGGVLAAASGVLAGVGATSPGAGPGLAVAIAAVAGAVAASIGWLVRRRAPQCTTCGGTRCAC